MTILPNLVVRVFKLFKKIWGKNGSKEPEINGNANEKIVKRVKKEATINNEKIVKRVRKKATINNVGFGKKKLAKVTKKES